MQRADHVVVGAGLLGLAAAWELHRRGRTVVVLDQADVGGPAAGSKGGARVFRLGYDDPGYVRLAMRTRALWGELEQEAGERLLYPVPQLTCGYRMGLVQAALTAAGAPGELLTGAQAAARFPAVAITDGSVLLEPQSAVIAADRVLRSLAAALPDVRAGSAVTGLADDGRKVTVRTRDGDLEAASAIVCAGPATSALLAPAGLRVPAAATLEQVGYLAPAGDQPAAMPIFIRYDDQAPYGLPVPGSSLYKIGIHPSGPSAGPRWEHEQSADSGLSRRLGEVARRYLPAFDPEPVFSERCVYDNSPDENFIIDRVGNVVVGCGTSGHGFKFGPLFGRWLANLATGTGGDLPDSQFRLARFS